MRDQNDIDVVLHRFVTRDQAERLLSAGPGEFANEPHLVGVANLFSVLRAPATPDEVVAAEPALAAFTAAVRDRTAASAPARTKPKSKFLTRKAVAALAAATVLSGGAAAAATGSLPGPVQDGVSRSLSHVGMDVPDSHDSVDDSHATVDNSLATVDDAPSFHEFPDPAAPPSAAPATAVGPDADGSAKHGLCTAYAASSGSNGKNLDSVAARNVAEAAATAGKSIDEYCADETTAGKPDGTGSSDNTGKPDDTGKPDNTNKPDDTGKPDNTNKSDNNGTSDSTADHTGRDESR